MADQHKTELDACHGSASSLYRVICACGWISGDSKEPALPEAEARGHLDGKTLPWQEGKAWDWTNDAADPRAGRSGAVVVSDPAPNDREGANSHRSD